MNRQDTATIEEWITRQHALGHPPAAMLRALQEAGWARAVAIGALERTLSISLANAKDQAGESDLADTDLMPALPVPKLVGQGKSLLQLPDAQVNVLARSSLPVMTLLQGFLTPQECLALMADARPRLTRSEIVVMETGDGEVNDDRTSMGMFFERGESALIQRIEARIEALTGWPADHGEGLQVLNYKTGGQYRPHYDYFDPDQPGAPQVLARGGQRVATLIMYLNTPPEGGATVFPDAGLEVAAIAGHAVFFSYNRPHPQTRTLHGGSPVLAGEKWVATKWFRERPFE